MNRSLDSTTQPSGSPVPLETDELNDAPLPPMESEADFLHLLDDIDWSEMRSPHTPEPVVAPIAQLSPASENRRQFLSACEYLNQFDQEAVNKLAELPEAEIKAMGRDEIMRRVTRKSSGPQDPPRGRETSSNSNSTVAKPVSVPLETEMQGTDSASRPIRVSPAHVNLPPIRVFQISLIHIGYFSLFLHCLPVFKSHYLKIEKLRFIYCKLI